MSSNEVAMVWQVLHVHPELYAKVHAVNDHLNRNDLTNKKCRETLRRVREQSQKLVHSMQSIQDDKRVAKSLITKLQETSSQCEREGNEIKVVVEDLPRLLEKVHLFNAQTIFTPEEGYEGEADDDSGENEVMFNIPAPTFGYLLRMFKVRAQQLWKRIRKAEAAIGMYFNNPSDVALTSQIEAVLRSQHARYRSISLQLASTSERVNVLSDFASRQRGEMGPPDAILKTDIAP